MSIKSILFFIFYIYCLVVIQVAPAEENKLKAIKALDSQVDYLFVFYDAGETRALLPVVEKLILEKRSVLVLTMGTALKIVSNILPAENLINVGTLIGQNIDATWKRDEKISVAQINAIKKQIHAKVVITGVASRVQHQILENYQDDAFTASYVDFIGPIEYLPYAALARSFVSISDLIMVPDKLSAQSLNSDKVKVVGHPAMENWIQQAKNVDQEKVKNMLNLDKNKPIITFVGGYEADYAAVFALFMEAVKPLTDYQVLISPHPKTQGDIEKAYLENQDCQNCQLTMDKVSTLAAITVSDKVLCRRTTVGIQALFLNKKVIYIDLPGQALPNPDVSHWHISNQLTDVSEIQRAIIDSTKHNFPLTQIHNKTGLAQQSEQLIVEQLIAAVNITKSAYKSAPEEQID